MSIDDAASRRRVVLTDDEVIALGARSGKPWPSPIFSVDVTDAFEVRRAVERGARSLIARGLLGVSAEDSLEAGISDILRPVLDGNLSLGTYLVDSKLAFAPTGLATAAYATNEEPWTSEIIAPNGLHYLLQEGSNKCLESIREFLESCFMSGIPRLPLAPPETSEPAFVCAMRRSSSDEIRVAAFRRDAAFCQTRPPSESEQPTDVLRPFESLESALSYLGL
ncbi:MAG: hypothetical protein QOF30_3441 [Acidimicrobiaceae bacterium]|jgi:hypothetical protein|nr:hypothetical protein [Acidimicrobiaceae bacterium]